MSTGRASAILQWAFVAAVGAGCGGPAARQRQLESAPDRLAPTPCRAALRPRCAPSAYTLTGVWRSGTGEQMFVDDREIVQFFVSSITPDPRVCSAGQGRTLVGVPRVATPSGDIVSDVCGRVRRWHPVGTALLDDSGVTWSLVDPASYDCDARDLAYGAFDDPNPESIWELQTRSAP